MSTQPTIHIVRDVNTFSAEEQDIMERRFRAGESPRVVLTSMGRSYWVFREWMKRGGDPEAKQSRCPDHIIIEPYHTFAQRMRAALTEGKRVLLPKRPHGPHPKPLTAEQREAILDGFRQGLRLHQVSRYAQVPISRLTSWLERGGYPKKLTTMYPIPENEIIEPYKSFVQEVLKAEDAFFTGET